MRVIWTPRRKAHLDGVYQYIKRDAPFYAKGWSINSPAARSNSSITRTPGRIVIAAMIETSAN